ncbi:MAG: ABC transporter ATP-binding protein [Vicinamibacteria bacterium]|nr:ABC transporter ATP-binding protein [Vicinamibacteria bacterium]
MSDEKPPFPPEQPSPTAEPAPPAADTPTGIPTPPAELSPTEPPTPSVPAPPPAPPAIELTGLRKLFGGVAAVDDLSLRVARGRFFGFLGPNGAGKSTTIKMLTGLLSPTAGAIRIEGIDPAEDLLAVKRVIGVLPEELPLYERLSGEEYLLFAGRMYGLSKAETRRRADELLDFLSLGDDRGKLIVDYSQGMRKKVALAAALIHSPRVLFLDEPLNGIDPVSARVVTDLLSGLSKKGVTLFFTSHVLDVVERLCDEVAVIDRGRLVAQGTLDEIRAQREVGGDASLEDVFLKLVAADVQRPDLAWLG